MFFRRIQRPSAFALTVFVSFSTHALLTHAVQGFSATETPYAANTNFYLLNNTGKPFRIILRLNAASAIPRRDGNHA